MYTKWWILLLFLFLFLPFSFFFFLFLTYSFFFFLFSFKFQTGIMSKMPFLRGCVMFGLVTLLWADIGLSGKSQGSSTRKPQVSIKSQTGVMAKKLWKITIFKRLRDVWFGKFFVRWYRNIREVTRVSHTKTPGL